MRCSGIRISFVVYETRCFDFKYSENTNQRRPLYLALSERTAAKWLQSTIVVSLRRFTPPPLLASHNLDADMLFDESGTTSDGDHPDPNFRYAFCRKPSAAFVMGILAQWHHGTLETLTRGRGVLRLSADYAIYPDLRKTQDQEIWGDLPRAQTALSCKVHHNFSCPDSWSFAPWCPCS